MKVVWRCKCGRTLVSQLDSARCPHCRSAYGTYNGRVVVTSGEWEVLNLPADAVPEPLAAEPVRPVTEPDGNHLDAMGHV